MILCLIVATVAGCLSAADDPNKDVVKSELEKLQGTWAQISAEGQGRKSVPAEKDRGLLIFTGVKWSMRFPGVDSTYAGTVELEPGKDPKVIKLTFTEGEFKGDTGQAIYRLEGDTLTICQIGGAKELPKDFKPGPRQTVTVFKRQKR